MSFGEVVKARRLELELTQRELADVAGTEQAMVSRIENYGIEPNFTLGYSILVALDLDVEKIYTDLVG